MIGTILTQNPKLVSVQALHFGKNQCFIECFSKQEYQGIFGSICLSLYAVVSPCCPPLINQHVTHILRVLRTGGLRLHLNHGGVSFAGPASSHASLVSQGLSTCQVQRKKQLRLQLVQPRRWSSDSCFPLPSNSS